MAFNTRWAFQDLAAGLSQSVPALLGQLLQDFDDLVSVCPVFSLAVGSNGNCFRILDRSASEQRPESVAGLYTIFSTDIVVYFGEASDDPTRYDVSLVVPGAKGESLHGLLPGIVCAAFGLKVTGETKDAEVLVLRAPRGKPEALRSTSTPGQSLWASQNGEVHIVDYPVSVLASILEGQIHKIVIDETGIQGKYDFDFKIDPKDPNSVLDVIRGYGFSIETNTRGSSS